MCLPPTLLTPCPHWLCLVWTVFPQKDRRLVATDEWLRVKGTRDVWAIGDCATIEQRRMRVSGSPTL